MRYILSCNADQKMDMRVLLMRCKYVYGSDKHGPVTGKMQRATIEMPSNDKPAPSATNPSTRSSRNVAALIRQRVQDGVVVAETKVHDVSDDAHRVYKTDIKPAVEHAAHKLKSDAQSAKRMIVKNGRKLKQYVKGIEEEAKADELELMLI